MKCLGNTIRTALRLSVENYDGIHIAFGVTQIINSSCIQNRMPIAGSAC